MKLRFTHLLFGLLLACGSVFAQDQNYDERLALKLGADAHGMKNYVLVILKTGDTQMEDKAKRDKIFAGHMENIGKMAEAGKLAVAGPFGKNENAFRGLYIFNVTSMEEAKELVSSDPAVAAGLLKAEYYPWYSSAALNQVNEIHNKIAKEKF